MNLLINRADKRLLGVEMTDCLLDIALEIDSSRLPEVMEHPSLLCDILESQSKLILGCLRFTRIRQSSHLETSKLANCQSFKRKPSTRLNVSSPKVPKRDVSQIFQDLNIVPQLSSDLQCAMCAYIATTKSSLRVHYKLKHLGGADLIETCPLCKKSIKMRKALKKHLINVHKLDENAAQKMIS